MNDFLKKLGIEWPILVAPMAGGPSTVELTAAASNAGALGSLGAAYLSPAEITALTDRTRQNTARPFNVNLFAGGYGLSATGPHPVDPEPMLALMQKIHHQLGLADPELPPLPECPFPAQIEAVLATRPAVFSFTFGVPEKEVVRQLHAAEIIVLGTATTVEEAWLLIEAGVDGIVAQGAEAGAHRGTFAGAFEAAMVPTLQLVREIAALSSTPVIASGGIMDGRDIAQALVAGASAVQMGTAFLPCPESGAPDIYKKTLLSAKTDTTRITRAFSGRPARGIANKFLEQLADREDIILPFPQQNSLTRGMRKAAAQLRDPRYLSLWAGTGVARARNMPAAELIRILVEEMQSFDLTKN